MIHYAIAHAAYADGRTASLRTLLEQLDASAVQVFTSGEREHATVWARRIYEWAAAKDAPTCILNDDVTVAPGLDDILHAILETTRAPLSLHVQGDTAAQCSKRGHRWIRYYDYSGPGVVLRPEHARSLLAFWNDNPSLQNKPHLNEDGVASQWAYDLQEPFWAPLPALAQHDVSIPSTLGYDKHAHRQTSVPWDAEWLPDDVLEQMKRPDYWAVPEGSEVPLIENPWFSPGHMELLRRQRLGLSMPPICIFCGKNPGVFVSSVTKATLCRICARGIADVSSQGMTADVTR